MDHDSGPNLAKLASSVKLGPFSSKSVLLLWVHTLGLTQIHSAQTHALVESIVTLVSMSDMLEPTVSGVTSYSLSLVTGREWNRFTKPVWVTGTGSHEYRCRYGFPYHEQQKEPKKSQNGVLYHSSGWICHASRQDPSHSDDDVTQYMQHGCQEWVFPTQLKCKKVGIDREKDIHK